MRSCLIIDMANLWKFNAHQVGLYQSEPKNRIFAYTVMSGHILDTRRKNVVKKSKNEFFHCLSEHPMLKNTEIAKKRKNLHDH
jgi:hypothetical protein